MEDVSGKDQIRIAEEGVQRSTRPLTRQKSSASSMSIRSVRGNVAPPENLLPITYRTL